MKAPQLTDDPIIIEQHLNAPVKKVWEALTENEQMKKWYFELKEFKPSVGFKFHFTGGKQDGKQYLHLCEVTEAIPHKKLAYSWRYEGYKGVSYVVFELIPEANKTKLRLTHKGLDSFPQNNPDFNRENFVKGWTQIIGSSLKKFIE